MSRVGHVRGLVRCEAVVERAQPLVGAPGRGSGDLLGCVEPDVHGGVDIAGPGVGADETGEIDHHGCGRSRCPKRWWLHPSAGRSECRPDGGGIACSESSDSLVQCAGVGWRMGCAAEWPADLGEITHGEQRGKTGPGGDVVAVTVHEVAGPAGTFAALTPFGGLATEPVPVATAFIRRRVASYTGVSYRGEMGSGAGTAEVGLPDGGSSGTWFEPVVRRPVTTAPASAVASAVAAAIATVVAGAASARMLRIFLSLSQVNPASCPSLRSHAKPRTKQNTITCPVRIATAVTRSRLEKSTTADDASEGNAARIGGISAASTARLKASALTTGVRPRNSG